MRVLLLSPTYAGGGAERGARELFDRLPSLGVQTEMWTAARRDGDPVGVHSLRFPLERYGYALDLVLFHTDWRHLGSRWHLAHTDKFDVVHLHNIHGRWASIRAIRDLCARMPSVWTLHDEWAPARGLACDLARVVGPEEAKRLSTHDLPYVETRGVKRLRRVLDRFMPQPRVVLCPSSFMARRAQESGVFTKSQIRQLPYGLTWLGSPMLEISREVARERYKLRRDAKVVLFIANRLDVAHKGADLAVEVLRGMKQRPQVLLLGRGTETLKAQLSGLDVVDGWADSSEMLSTAYRAADVTLVPSRADNFPYVVLESFACGTPVAAFAVGGLTEMLGDERGLLAPPFDVAVLRANVERLLDDAELRQKVSEKGRAWVAEHCDMSRYLEATIAVYREALALPRPAQ